MRKWVSISAALHVVAFLLLWLGLPHLTPEIIDPPVIVPVDIAQVSDITATKVQDKPEPPRPIEKPPEKPLPEPPKPPPEPKPEPKPEPPTPPPTPEPKPEPKPPAETKPEVKPEEKAKLPVPKPKEKPKPKVEEKPKIDPLASVLKNVAKLKAETTPEKTDTKPDKEAKPAPSTPSSPVTAEHLSVSEEDALRRQIASCWNVPIGARDIENMVVEVVITVNPDRTVKESIVSDQARMGRDPFFRTVAESAQRALQNPRCSPLALPPEKYQQWKEIIFTFNAKDMF